MTQDSAQAQSVSGGSVLIGQIANTTRTNRDAVDVVKFSNGTVSTEFSGRFASVAQLPNGTFEQMSRSTYFLDVKIRTEGCGFALEAGDFIEVEGFIDVEEWDQNIIEFVYSGDGPTRKQQFAESGGKRIPLVTERKVKRRKNILTNIQSVKRLDNQPPWWGGSRSAAVITGLASIPLDEIPDAGFRRNGGAAKAPVMATAEV